MNSLLLWAEYVFFEGHMGDMRMFDLKWADMCLYRRCLPTAASGPRKNKNPMLHEEFLI